MQEWRTTKKNVIEDSKSREHKKKLPKCGYIGKKRK
jgi:hypothetical protein